MLTDAELDDMEKRLSLITPGRWHSCLGSGEHMMTGISAEQPNGHSTFVADCLTERALKDGTAPADHRPNMRFIGNAPDDMRALLAEVRRLRAEAAPVLMEEEIAALKRGGVISLSPVLAARVSLHGTCTIEDSHAQKALYIHKDDRKRLAAALLIEREVTP